MTACGHLSKYGHVIAETTWTALVQVVLLFGSFVDGGLSGCGFQDDSLIGAAECDAN
jgi:hypothetical protein